MWFSVNSLNWISKILESFVLPGKIVAIIGIPISSVINDIFDVLCFNNWGVYPVLSIPNLFYINVMSVKKNIWIFIYIIFNIPFYSLIIW